MIGSAGMTNRAGETMEQRASFSLRRCHKTVILMT
jgi:hypothetical protein